MHLAETELTEWQFRQNVGALRILFCDLIRSDWSKNCDQYGCRAFAKNLEPDHSSLFRDGSPSVLVAPNNNPLINCFRQDFSELHYDFIKTILVRIMSVQTEKQYHP